MAEISIKNNLDHWVPLNTSNKPKKVYSRQAFTWLLLLAACGNDEVVNIIVDDGKEEEQTQDTVLVINTNYQGESEKNDVISSTYNVFSTINSIEDTDTSDDDELSISTSEDIQNVPIVNGFETIVFTIDENFTSSDDIFDIGLEKFSNFKTISFTKSITDSSLSEFLINNAHGKLIFNSGISKITANVITNEDLTLFVKENSEIDINNSAANIYINANGNSVLVNTDNKDNVEITESSGVTLFAPMAEGNIKVISNDDVVIGDANSLQGNVEISAVGAIDLFNLASATGKLDLENLRATSGENITLTNVTDFKSVDIKSAGSVNINNGSGLNETETIKITAAEPSSINAQKEVPRSVTLNATNSSNSEVQFTIDINSITDLTLEGSSPILVSASGSDMDKVSVTSSNSAASALFLSGANTDFSRIASNVQIRLQNFDGNKIIVGTNQNLAIDAEIPQTSIISPPELIFSTDATSASQNTINIKAIDTTTTNTDDTADLAGLTTTDIQTLNFDLSDGINLNVTQNITGIDLQKIGLSGSGDFTLTNSSVTGGLNYAVSLDATNFTGTLTLSIDATASSLQTVIAGSGNDFLEVDGKSISGSTISINSAAGNDTITMTTNSDGDLTSLNIDGGDGIDKIKFATGLDYSLSNLTISNVESFEFTGGSNPVKLPSNTLSGKTLTVSENGTGTLNLTVIPENQIIDLSSLVFDNSISAGIDNISIDGANFGQALTITGTRLDETITGSLSSNDVITSGDGNDTINGNDGNDTLTPGNGVDHITPGLGNDVINLSETISSVDKIYYSMDDGSGNVDTVTGFDVRIANDIISLDVSEVGNPITFGNGTAAAAAAAGTITILEHNVDTDINYSSNSSVSIIKLTAVNKSTFETALGSSTITVANDASLNFLWYDVDTSEVVFGYTNENVASPDSNEIKADDSFTEIVRISMSTSNYTHYLDADNFTFI